MRLVGGLLVFAAAGFFGVFGAWIGAVIGPHLVLPEVEVSEYASFEPGVAPMPTGIHVMYSGTGGLGGEPYLKFIIHNGGHEPLSYFAYTAAEPFPRLRVNGGDLPTTYDCTQGASQFAIAPGRSAEVRVYSHDFRVRPPGNARVAAGFYLLPNSSAVHYSEPFLLPEEFRRSISKY